MREGYEVQGKLLLLFHCVRNGERWLYCILSVNGGNKFCFTMNLDKKFVFHFFVRPSKKTEGFRPVSSYR